MVRVVRSQPLPETARRHPLAHQSGIELLMAMVAADEHWRPLTKRQKAVLRDAYRARLDGVALADDATEAEVEAPRLADTTHPATVRSLIGRGLAVDGGWLTPLAVHVVKYADRDEERPVRTAQPAGDVL